MDHCLCGHREAAPLPYLVQTSRKAALVPHIFLQVAAHPCSLNKPNKHVIPQGPQKEWVTFLPWEECSWELEKSSLEEYKVETYTAEATWKGRPRKVSGDSVSLSHSICSGRVSHPISRLVYFPTDFSLSPFFHPSLSLPPSLAPKCIQLCLQINHLHRSFLSHILNCLFKLTSWPLA